MAIGKQLSDANLSGTSLGQSSTDLISFYGVAPVARPTCATTSATLTGANATAAVIATGATAYGYANATQANAIVTALNAAITDLAVMKASLGASGIGLMT